MRSIVTAGPPSLRSAGTSSAPSDPWVPARVKILVIGSGGREHAIIRRLAADRPAPELHAAPGNPGIAQLATCHDVAVATSTARCAWPMSCSPTWW